MRIGWFLVRTIVALLAISIVNYMLKGRNPYFVTFVDLLIVVLSDPIDSWPHRIREGDGYNQTYEYAALDKITDMFLYGFVVVNHIYRVGTIGMFEAIFIGTYLYRLIGVIVFLATNDGKVLVYFPSFIEVFILYLGLRYVLMLPNAIVVPITVVAVPIKIIYEYWHHVLYRPQISIEKSNP